MDVPQQIVQWVEARYTHPRIDPEWLHDCYAWLITDGGHNPTANLDELLDAMEHQILESNLCDSMLPGTGLPANVALPTTTTVLRDMEVLVEVASVTEIATSAFTLNQIRIAREERMKTGDPVDQDGEGDIDVEGEGPMPKYPRGMLKFQLTDGTTILPAIEYKPLPQFSLENTPLGYKLILKEVPIRRGTAFLAPECIITKGHRTEERDESRQADFARGLFHRMGTISSTELISSPQNHPSPLVQMNQHPPPSQFRSPLCDVPAPRSSIIINDDEHLEPQRRRIPNQQGSQVVSNTQLNRPSTVVSSYFANGANPHESEIELSLSPPGRRSDVREFAKQPPTKNQPRLKDGRAAPKRTKPHVHNIESDDDGVDFEFNDDVFEDLDRIEREAYAQVNQSTQEAAGGPLFIQGAHAHRPPAISMNDHVISIEDDEPDDKENVPVPTRHVRRRIEHQPGRNNSAMEVIELGDSD